MTTSSNGLARGKGFVHVVGYDKDVTAMFYNRGYGITNIQKEADILAFIGGFDIDPSLYGQKRNTEARVTVSFEDDRRDTAAWKMSETRQTKVGICRG